MDGCTGRGDHIISGIGRVSGDTFVMAFRLDTDLLETSLSHSCPNVGPLVPQRDLSSDPPLLYAQDLTITLERSRERYG